MSKPVQVITSVERRRKWSLSQKQSIVDQTYEPGATVSGVAREHKIPASLLFAWRRELDKQPTMQLINGGQGGGGNQDEIASLKAKIRALEGILGRKVAEIELMRETFL